MKDSGILLTKKAQKVIFEMDHLPKNHIFNPKNGNICRTYCMQLLVENSSHFFGMNTPHCTTMMVWRGGTLKTFLKGLCRLLLPFFLTLWEAGTHKNVLTSYLDSSRIPTTGKSMMPSWNPSWRACTGCCCPFFELMGRWYIYKCTNFIFRLQ